MLGVVTRIGLKLRLSSSIETYFRNIPPRLFYLPRNTVTCNTFGTTHVHRLASGWLPLNAFTAKVDTCWLPLNAFTAKVDTCWLPLNAFFFLDTCCWFLLDAFTQLDTVGSHCILQRRVTSYFAML